MTETWHKVIINYPIRGEAKAPPLNLNSALRQDILAIFDSHLCQLFGKDPSQAKPIKAMLDKFNIQDFEIF